MTHKHEWDIDSWDVHIECNCGSVLDIGEATCRLNATEKLSAKIASGIAKAIDDLGRAVDGKDGGKSTAALRAYAEEMDKSVVTK